MGTTTSAPRRIVPFGSSSSTAQEFATHLCLAAGDGSVGVLGALLDRPAADVNVGRKSDGAHPLYLAAETGHVEAVKLLLGVPGIDVNKTWEGATPLFIAATEGCVDVVEILLAREGIDVNKARSDGATPIFMAAQEGHVEVVKLLLAKEGIDGNRPLKTELSTPLFIAAQKGHVEIVKLLLAVPGVNVNVRLTTSNKPTLLYTAACNKHESIVRLLLAVPGIAVDAPSYCGKSVRTHAMEGSFTSAINRLILSHTAAFSTFVANQLLELAVLKHATCPITFEPINAGTTTIMSCGHLFARDALATSFATARNVCPVCRVTGSAVDV